MLSDILIAVADFLWGTPMTVVLVGTGLYLSIRFRFYYNFRKIGFNWKNTYGRMFQRAREPAPSPALPPPAPPWPTPSAWATSAA